MHSGKFVFSQVMERMPHWEFQRVARRHGVDSAKLGFTAWEHFSAMAFAQLTFRESLRDIEACLSSQRSLAYHLGFRRAVRRSTLAYANEHRDWRFFAELGQRMMQRARSLYRNEPFGVDLAGELYALDATMIDLSLALCPWANWTGTDAAVKMHTMLDLRGPLPSFVTITRGEQNEMAWLDEIPLEAGSYYVMDRGYLDLRRLQRFTREGAFFVIRERPDLKFYVAESRPVDRTTTLRCDQTIRFNGGDSRRSWPERMRRVGNFDAEHSRRMAFWTNQWTLPAATISELYRQRWQIEIFFRWVKQNLRIRSFYGTTSNAVRVQLWTAICTYLAVAITRKQLGLTRSLTAVLQILSVNAFQKVPIVELFAEPDTSKSDSNTQNQLTLNGF
ncbi:MAG: IS4 family transposase [Verrucomicrobia bacterium]|nr:IS4 family transposase [Verrucomicrobiota bacterium]